MYTNNYKRVFRVVQTMMWPRGHPEFNKKKKNTFLPSFVFFFMSYVILSGSPENVLKLSTTTRKTRIVKRNKVDNSDRFHNRMCFSRNETKNSLSTNAAEFNVTVKITIKTEHLY